LVVEVDITSSSQSRLSIYQTMGVPEIWRYHGQSLTILQLHQGNYQASEQSAIFPLISVLFLTSFLEKGKHSRNHNGLMQELRQQLRTLIMQAKSPAGNP
jgi:hypothetical protein